MNNQEKAAFIAALTREPCKPGRDAFLGYAGSIEDYFDKCPRGTADLLWCVANGLMESRWAYIATPERIDACAERNPILALQYAAAHLTPKRLAACYTYIQMRQVLG